MCSSRFQQFCGVLLAVLGLLILAVTLGGHQPLREYLDEKIKQQVALSPGTVSYENWQKPPVPVYDDFLLFNITNPYEYSNGSKAIIDVVGPFCYKKIEIKKQANFSGDLKYAMYYDYEIYVYDSERTKANNNLTTLNDTIYVPNVPLFTVVAQIVHNPLITEPIRIILEEILETYEMLYGNTYLTLNGTVQQILWGLDDPIMKILNTLKLAPTPQFALQTNGSSDADALLKQTVVYTGHTDISRVDEYYLYHGKNSSGCWGSEAANVVNGTEGSMFEPLLIYNKTKPVSIYNDQLYRSIDLTFTNESSYEGISCNVYRIPDYALQNMTNNPINVGYYAYVYSGALNLTGCTSGVPLYITKALFLDADARIPENITISMKPNKTLHDTYLCVEPYTGVVIDGHKRVQVSMRLEHHPSVGIINKTQPAFIPLVSVDEHGSITPDLAGKLKAAVLVPIQAVNIGFYVLCCLSSFLILTAVIVNVRVVNDRCRRHRQAEDKEVLVDAEEKEKEIEEDKSESIPSDQYLSFDGGNSKYYDLETS